MRLDLLLRRLGMLAVCLLIGSTAVVATPARVAASPTGTNHTRAVGHPVRMASPTPATVDVRRAVRLSGSTTRPRSVSLPAPATRAPSSSTRPLDGGPPPPVLVSTTGAPAIGEPGFAGFSADGPLTNLEPADSSVAVGPDNVVQAVNAGIRFSNRQGSLSVADLGLAAFFRAGARQVSSPRVIYDPVHARWLAIEESWDCISDANASFGHGYLDLAVSRTTDPTGTWDVYPLRFDDELPDMATIGVSTDKVGISANVYPFVSQCTFGSFAASYVAALDWSGLSSGRIAGYATTDSTRFGVQVADQVPAVTTALQLLDQYNDGSGDIEYFNIDGTTSGGTIAFNPSFDLASYGVAGPSLPLGGLLPQQPGPAAITADIDNRLTGAVWQNNKLVTTSTYPCHPTGDTADRLCVRVTELNTSIVDVSTPPSLFQDFLLNSVGRDTYVGAAGLSGNGTLHVVFNQSSATPGDFASSYDVYRLPTDPLNSTSAAALLQAGLDVYAGSEWGDYTSVAQDPQVPNAVWQANEYVNAAQHWSTYVNQLKTIGTTYVPITPVRIVDSRDSTKGLSGLAGKFVSSVARTFAVAGLGPIPPTAVAVTGNLTVANQTAAGYIALTPDPTSNPGSSTLNFPVGDNRANNVTIPLNAQGQLAAVYKASAGKTTDLIFDVTGYFVAGTSQATYVSITPVRALDTRFGTGLAGKFSDSAPRTLQISGPSAGLGVPPEAVAITGNLTVAGQSKPGYLALTPDPTSSPLNSNLNFPLGDNRANGVAAPLNGSGALSIVYKAAAGATTNVILDITGYFVPGSAGMVFYPLNPSRIMDTRTTINTGLTGVFHANVSRTLAVNGHWGVPTDAGAVTGNLTVAGQTGAGYVTMTPDPTTAPGTSTLNFPLADNRANGVFGQVNLAGHASFVYKAAAGTTTHLILDLSGYFR